MRHYSDHNKPGDNVHTYEDDDEIVNVYNPN